MKVLGTLISFALAVLTWSGQSAAQAETPLPASDPANEGGWVLNTDLSDEFNGTQIDHDKWLVQGLNGDYYIWKGRPPSQYAPHNAIVEDGFLKIRSRWEPDYPFADESYADGGNNDRYGELDGVRIPVTTAAIVSKKRFLNGYMEVRSKANPTSMISAFWLIGFEQELDVFEHIGNPQTDGNLRANNTSMTVHDWSPPSISGLPILTVIPRQARCDLAGATHASPVRDGGEAVGRGVGRPYPGPWDVVMGRISTSLTSPFVQRRVAASIVSQEPRPTCRFVSMPCENAAEVAPTLRL